MKPFFMGKNNMKKNERNVTPELAEYERRILELLIIDESSPSGLRWNQGATPQVRGKPAGVLVDKGYWRIGVRVHGKQKNFFAHRVVWFLVNGYWPVDLIDHINGDGRNNRISNLRESSSGENSRNAGMSVRNSSGIKGVCRKKATGKWVARVKFERKNIHLGYFDDIADAEQAVMAARKQLHGEFANHGIHREAGQ